MGNYTIGYVNGTLTVNPAALTITANNATKANGASLPLLGVSYSGFVNGDTAANLTTPPTLATTATASSHVFDGGLFDHCLGASDPDYTITYVPGTLTITAAPLTVTANDAAKVYGAALPALSAGYSGLVNGDTVASLTRSAHPQHDRLFCQPRRFLRHLRERRGLQRLYHQLRGRDLQRQSSLADYHGQQRN